MFRKSGHDDGQHHIISLPNSIEGEFEFSTPVDPGIFGRIFGVIFGVKTYACPNFRA